MPNSSFKNKISIFQFLLLLFVSFFLISCENSEPEILSVTSSVVFDFKDDSSFAVPRLSVFVETGSDARRVDFISVTCKKNNYTWIDTSPELISSNSTQWAGSSNLALANNDAIPFGLYDLKYSDAEGREVQTVFSVFDTEMYKNVLSTKIKTLLTEDYNEKIAIYDSSDILLYYGEKNSSWKTDEDVFSLNSKAAYYRTCYEIFSGGVIFLLPPVNKKNF